MTSSKLSDIELNLSVDMISDKCSLKLFFILSTEVPSRISCDSFAANPMDAAWP